MKVLAALRYPSPALKGDALSRIGSSNIGRTTIQKGRLISHA
jgi:hypothetical protein